MNTNPPDWAIRTKADLKAIQEGAYWDQSKGDAFISFATAFFRTQYSTEPFRLHQWQERFLRSIISWRRADGGRRFRFAHLHIGKKAGKTLIESLCVLHDLFQCEESSPYIVAGACSTENAKQIFDEVVHALKTSGLDQFCEITPYRKSIYVPSTNAKFKVISREGEHGPNCTMVAMDELHAHASAKLFESLRHAGKDRKSPIVLMVSTAGNNTGHFYFDLYLKSKRIIEGTDLDTQWYADVYESDPDADPFDPVQWHKANPSPINEEQFRKQLEADKQVPCLWLNTQQMYLNRWVRPEENAWLDVSDWDNHELDISDDELAKCEATLGADFSSVGDPSSASICWALPDKRFFIRSWAWVAQQAVNKRLSEQANLPAYQTYPEMTVTDGDRIDDQRILAFMLELCERYKVRYANYDPAAGGHILMGQVESEGYTIQSFNPSARNYNGAMREFEKAYQEGRILHGPGQTWLRYCFSNVRFGMNSYKEMFPFKKNMADKWDGACSVLVAYISHVNGDLDSGTQVYFPTA